MFHESRVAVALLAVTLPLTAQNWSARTFFRGSGAFNQDLSIFETIPITERFRTRITADFFNVFNHPVDIAPNDTTGLQDLIRQDNDPRIIQFSLRVEW